MLIISILSLVAHLLILLRAAQFFVGPGGDCRDQDRHMVGAISVLSAVFLSTWGASMLRPEPLQALSELPLLAAHNLAVAVILLGHIQSIVTRKCDRRAHDHPV